MSTDERTLGERVEAVRLALSTDLFQDGLLRAMVAREADALLLEQQAEIERLTTNEAERVRVFERDGYSMMPRKLRCADEAIDELTTERDSLRRDLDSARADVARMDFIHKSVNYIDMYMDAAIVLWGDDEGRAHSIEDGNLRAAIDLARARGEGNDDE